MVSLKTSKEFQNVFDRGFRTKKFPFSIIALKKELPEAQKAVFRYGIIIAKRNVKLAVSRNRLRRVLKGYFREVLCPNLKASYDVVVIASHGADEVESHRLREALDFLFKEINEKNTDIVN